MIELNSNLQTNQRNASRKNMFIPEILAPVGSQDALIAAVRSGADAVYFGTGECNARRSAGKFEGDELVSAVNYCHARNVRVYLTVNTLLWDDELPAAKKTIEAIAESGADGMIIQDLAVAKLAREICPSVGRHASTQMAVHNAQGVIELAEHGFSRVVLARELTGKEIQLIRKETGVELEVFIHGALCMSASGMCYLSSSLGERSGNRGTCAQPCRLPFNCRGAEYCMSLKDMSHLQYLGELSQAGINSLKIEGRLKRPEYVAAAVNAARKALAGEPYRTDELQSVFSRSGFTDGYYAGKRDRRMFGTRTQEDAARTKEAAGGFKELYRAERNAVPFLASFVAHRDEPVELIVSDGIRTVSSFGKIPEPALNSEASKESVQKSIAKSGGTPFYLSDFKCDLDEGLMIPSSELNRMRREALEKLLHKHERTVPHPVQNYILPAAQRKTEKNEKQFRCRFLRAEQVFSDSRMSAFSLPISELKRFPEMINDRTQAEIPELVYPFDENKLIEDLLELKEKGLRSVLANNYGAIRMAKAAGLEVHGGYGFNVTNSLATRELKEFGVKDLTLSFELPFSKMKLLNSPVPTGCIICGKLPLMQLRSCPGRGTKGCGDCNGAPLIEDRMKKQFELVCHDRKYSTLLNSVLYYTADKVLPPMDFYVLYFSLETKEKAHSLFHAAVLEEKCKEERTTGASFRVLL